MFLIAMAIAAAPPPAEPAPQPMTVEVTRDAINDRLRATATLRADGERIEIRCRAPHWGDVSVEYHSRRWIARGNFLSGRQPVTYRFDEQRPVRRFWHVRDRVATLDDRGRVTAFLGSLMSARRLVLRTRDVENRTFDAVFPIGETRPAIVELLRNCGSTRTNARILGAE